MNKPKEDARLGLLAAAKFLREKGWTRGRFCDVQTQERCIWGAIMATSDISLWDGMRQRMWSILGPHVPGQLEPIVQWNDHVCSSGEEAARFLERAAGVE